MKPNYDKINQEIIIQKLNEGSPESNDKSIIHIVNEMFYFIRIPVSPTWSNFYHSYIRIIDKDMIKVIKTYFMTKFTIIPEIIECPESYLIRIENTTTTTTELTKIITGIYSEYYNKRVSDFMVDDGQTLADIVQKMNDNPSLYKVKDQWETMTNG